MRLVSVNSMENATNGNRGDEKNPTVDRTHFIEAKWTKMIPLLLHKTAARRGRGGRPSRGSHWRPRGRLPKNRRAAAGRDGSRDATFRGGYCLWFSSLLSREWKMGARFETSPSLNALLPSLLLHKSNANDPCVKHTRIRLCTTGNLLGADTRRNAKPRKGNPQQTKKEIRFLIYYNVELGPPSKGSKTNQIFQKTQRSPLRCE